MSHYQRTAAIVLGALDLDPSDREAFLERECGGDAALRREVASLLDAHDRAESFLETPAAAELGDEQPDEFVGRDIGAYRIDRILGEGGMGVVYLAEDTRLGRTVALKAIAPRFAEDHSWRERLRREARAAAALTHPGVATVYALEEIDGRLFIASEHVDGETLRDALARGPLASAEVMRIGGALANALGAAHDRGIVHRDLKPENVMRGRDGVVKILDFGLARLDAAVATGGNQPQLTAAGAVFGTPAYMSPEQLRGEPADGRSDLFACGVILAELSAGRHPFDGPNPSVTMARVLSSEPDLTGMPEPLASIVRRCVSKSAAERYHSAKELAAALQNVPGSEFRVPGSEFRVPGRAFWWWQFHQFTACAMVVVLFLALWAVQAWLQPGPAVALLLLAVAGGLGASTLRLHLWFTARVNPGEVAAQHALTRRWVLAGDLAFLTAILIAALLIAPDHRGPAAWLVATAVALGLASLVIEPATTRAAKIT